MQHDLGYWFAGLIEDQARHAPGRRIAAFGRLQGFDGLVDAFLIQLAVEGSHEVVGEQFTGYVDLR